MADAVHFLTNNPAVPGDAYGCSGFPFRVFDSGATVGPNSQYPFSLPLEMANSLTASCARTFNRGKILHAESDLSYTPSGGALITFTSGDLTPSGVVPTRELDLIKPTAQVKDFDADLGGLVRFNIITIKTALFYPGFLVTFVPTGLLITTFPTGAGITPTGNIDGTYDGVSFKLYYDASGYDTFNLTFFDLTWVEFWPYAAADSTPIYDVSNGLELQSPRN